MEGLIEGRIVHYVAYNQRHLAALVIGTDGDCVDLAVFTNLQNVAGTKNFGLQFHQQVSYAEDLLPGTWHWIERV